MPSTPDPGPLGPDQPHWPPHLARRIDRICDRYETDWQEAYAADQVVPLDDYLPAMPLPHRAALLYELIVLDADLRRRHGLTLRAADYLATFPSDADLVERALRGDGLPPAVHPGHSQADTVTSDTATPDGPTLVVDTPIPASIGRFPIQRVLGEGAFGIVYLGHDDRLDRPVALKVAKAAELGNPSRARRFLREARAAAGLTHPHIVSVYEAGERAGEIYIASAFIAPGRTLKQHLLESRPPLDEAVMIVRALAEALAYAHGQGTIHRDVKPSNILLDKAGRPHLTDFGLASRRDGEETLTREGQVLGTPLYMAPEQAAGLRDDVGPAADQYSLGCVFYELLTGQPPFSGTIESVLTAHGRQEPTSPRRLRADVPAELEKVCLKCLEKRPGDRYPSCQSLADDLRRWLEGDPVSVRPLTLRQRVGRWCRKEPRLAASILGLMGLGLVASAAFVALLIMWFRLELAEAVADEQKYHRLASALQARAVKPQFGDSWRSLEDLATLVTLPSAANELPLLRSQAAHWLTVLDARPIGTAAETLHVGQVAFSPDGQLLAACQEYSPESEPLVIQLVDVASQQTRRTLKAPISPEWEKRHDKADGIESVAFSPDGTWLVIGTRSCWVHRWRLADQQSEPTGRFLAWPANDPEWRYFPSKLIFSSDGQSLYLGQGESPIIARVDVNRWTVAAHHLHGLSGFQCALDPHDRHVAAYLDDPLRLEFLDPLTLQPERRESPVHSKFGTNLQFTPDGRSLLMNPGTFALIDARHPEIRFPFQITPEAERSMGEPTFQLSSPDGRWLAAMTRVPSRVQLWDLLAGRLAVSTSVPQLSPKCAVDPQSHHLAATSTQGAPLFEMANRGVLTAAGFAPQPIIDFAFAPDTPSLAVIQGPNVRSPNSLILDPWQTNPVDRPGVLDAYPLPGEYGYVARTEICPEHTGLTYAADGTLLAMVPWAYGLRHNQPFEIGQLLAQKSGGHPHSDAQGRLWFVNQHRVWVWDLENDRQALPVWENIEANGNLAITNLALAVGQRFAATGDRLGLVHRLDLTTNQRLRVDSLENEWISSLAFSEGDRWLAVGCRSGTVRLFDLEHERMITAPSLPEDVSQIVFITDELLALGCFDGGVRLWQLDNDGVTELLTLPHLAPVEHVRRAPDGVTLGVSVRGERAVRLWHLDRLWSNLNDLDLGQGLPTLPTPRPLTKPFPRRDKTKPPIDRFLTGDTKHLPVDSPHGLRVDYFGNPDLSGRPVVSGLVANIDFDWGSKQPTTGVPANHFSVRWTGTLTAPQPGQYDLQVYVDDWARLWIDDTLVIDAWDRPVGVHGCTVNLTGQPQRIRLDYAEITGFAECHLSWRPHGTKAFSIIPTPAFSPR